MTGTGGLWSAYRPRPRLAFAHAARAFVEGHPDGLAGAGCDGGAVDKRECLTLALADHAEAMQRAARDRTFGESPWLEA